MFKVVKCTNSIRARGKVKDFEGSYFRIETLIMQLFENLDDPNRILAKASIQNFHESLGSLIGKPQHQGYEV